MKRLITFISLIVIIFLGYKFITKGAGDKIVSYNTIETKSEALTKKLAAYDKRNQDDFEAAKSTLDSSIKTYKNSKEKYETIYKELTEIMQANPNSDESEQIEQVIVSDQKVYFWDYILYALGTYGKKHGVDVNITVSTSAQTNPASSLYDLFIADVNFTITGAYMNVSNFISELENDSELAWEINDFSMESGSANGFSGVSAKFNVKGIPIDSKSYINTVQNQTTDNTNNGGTTEDTTNTVGNAVDGNVVSNSTTNSADTNTVSK